MPTKPSKELEIFENPCPQRDYLVTMVSSEFTCLCPITGQPDFATIHIGYMPGQWCVELKSLKLYLWSYRNEGAFHEAVTNKIAGDMIKSIDPRYLNVRARFKIRGGITTEVVVEHVGNQGSAIHLPRVLPAVEINE